MQAIVIPTYNEAENIERLLREIRSVFDGMIILVDDASPDGTADRAAALLDPRLRVIVRSGKLGLGSAYREGFSLAIDLGADEIAQMDADLSHAPHDLPKLFARLQSADLVLGSRYVDGGEIHGWGIWRHFCSRSAMWAARVMLRLPTKDITTGFRVWRADLLTQILSLPLKGNSYAFQEEMLFHALKLNSRVVEEPIIFQDRQKGNSKLGIADIVEFFLVMRHIRREYL